MSVSDNAVLETASTVPHPYIHERLDRIKRGIEEADHQTRMLALLAGDIYAILSVQTPVSAHERAFIEIWYNSPNSEAELADLLHDVHSPDGSDNVLFHNNKARYIWKTLHEVDYNEQAELYQQGDWRTSSNTRSTTYSVWDLRKVRSRRLSSVGSTSAVSTSTSLTPSATTDSTSPGLSPTPTANASASSANRPRRQARH